jgi:protein-S-isoprenylcysteine O-methyltransferase Ste14
VALAATVARIDPASMESRAFALARSAFFATLFVSLWTWFIPRWIAGSRGVALEPRPGFAAIALMALGAIVMIACVWNFAWTGRGTPAPWDPPRRLVIRGLYRWVRNPMYVGMGAFLIGEALLLPAIRNAMLIVAAGAWILVTVFIVVYEEPTLRRLFGSEYEEYCRNVRRWIPRLTPFDKPSGAAVTSTHLD